MTVSLTLVSAHGHRTHSTLDAFVTADLRERARADANAFIKRLRLVRYGAQTMRERFTYRDESLWWFTELYLHKMRRIERAVTTVLAIDAAIAAETPAQLVVENADATIASVARAMSAARGIPIDIGPVRPLASVAHQSRLIGVNARLSRWRPRSSAASRAARIAAFVHTAFWRVSPADDGPGEEGYLGPVLAEVAGRIGDADLALVGVGPRRNFRARRWWDPLTTPSGATHITPIEQFAPTKTIQSALTLWADRLALADAIVGGDDVRASATYLACDLWDVLARDLREVALLQWPWSARAMDEAGAALDALQPTVAVTYAEAGGWGRAIVLEARRRGIRSVGIQHGFIYRHWLNYLHEPDEMAPAASGAPIPNVTLLFDRYAAEHLETRGHFPALALTVTGNARLDAMAQRISSLSTSDREAARVMAGARPGDPLAVVAAKFTEIRDLLPAFVRAVAALPAVHVAIKPHPAETPEVYAPFAHGVGNMTILPTAADLAPLVACADALVTMNSTVAIDALAIGVPSLVVGVPNNLSPFVEAGVMMGADAAEASMREGLRRVLYDQEARREILARAELFLDRYGMRPTGRAAERAADAILAGFRRTDVDA